MAHGGFATGYYRDGVWHPIPPTPTPPDPHVAALHRIAEAIDGLAAAYREVHQQPKERT